MAHALLSPSSAARWMRCPGSIGLIAQAKPAERTSEYAEEGTYAHAVAAAVLENAKSLPLDERFVLDDVRQAVKPYTDYVQSLPGVLLVEQRLPISSITGEPEAYGTADAVVVHDDRLTIVDLKFGMGVRVEAVGNPQLAVYAAAAAEALSGVVGDFTRVRMVIVQPRLDHISEWELPADEFRAFIDEIRACAAKARAQIGIDAKEMIFSPSVTACRFCPIAASCAAFAKFSTGAALGEPVEAQGAMLEPAELAAAFSKVEAVELWCSKMRQAVFESISAGRDVPGYKLVAGREGPRKWEDDVTADELMRAMRVPAHVRHEVKVISPARVQKLIKAGKISERQWARLEALVTRAEGKPAIAPESDPRPSIYQISGEMFKPLTSSN